MIFFLRASKYKWLILYSKDGPFGASVADYSEKNCDFIAIQNVCLLLLDNFPIHLTFIVNKSKITNPLKDCNVKNVIAVTFANSMNLDQTPRNSASDQAPSCLTLMVYLFYQRNVNNIYINTCRWQKMQTKILQTTIFSLSKDME